jgi:acetylornithine deacetylase
VVPKGSAALIGEPSTMKIITGHKGGTGYHVHVKGFEVHSSLLPEGVSAIMEGARLIQWVNDRNDAIQAAPARAGLGDVPPALHHAACGHDRRRHRPQHHRRRLPLCGGNAGDAR